MKRINLPISDADLISLTAGDEVELTGVIYTARDAAHKNLTELLRSGKSLPIELSGSAIYYVGPTPPKPGQVIGSAGPTSSYRMDAYAEPLLKSGLKLMIGKGPRSEEYKSLLKKYRAVYLSAIGGAAASIAKSVKACRLVAYPELGPEAIYRLEVENFYAVVTYDAEGGDLFFSGIEKYRK